MEDKIDSDKRQKNNNPGTKIDVGEKKSEIFDWRAIKEIVTRQERNCGKGKTS